MKVLICGPALSEEMEMKAPGASPAAGKYIRNLVKGLKNNNALVKTITYVTIPVNDSKYRVKTLEEDNNIYFFKDKLIFPSMLQFRRKFKKIVDKETIVIFYNISYSVWGLIDNFKSKGIKSLLILADYTNSIEYNNSIRKFMAKNDEKEFKKFEYAVILSANVKKMLNQKCKSLLLEGGINVNDYLNFNMPIIKNTLVVMYSGLLSNVTGVNILLEAMQLNNNDNIRLIITGKGELEKNVIEAAKEDKRIEYLGFVSNKKFYELLAESHVLLNPRNMTLEQNSNNFPSKVLEYLATGRIVLSTKFAGYENFVENFIFADVTAYDFSRKMNEIYDKRNEYLLKYYTKNREYSLKYDWNNQAKKILQLLNDGESDYE